MPASDTLPPLTERQEQILDYVVTTWTEPFKPFRPTATTLPNIARALDLSLAQFLAELTVLAPHLEAIREFSDLETTVHAAGARRIALDTLSQIASDPETDRLERRRAASSILRATAIPRPKRTPSNDPPPWHFPDDPSHRRTVTDSSFQHDSHDAVDASMIGPKAAISSPDLAGEVSDESSSLTEGDVRAPPVQGPPAHTTHRDRLCDLGAPTANTHSPRHHETNTPPTEPFKPPTHQDDDSDHIHSRYVELIKPGFR